jgi:hypothetical protein
MPELRHLRRFVAVAEELVLALRSTGSRLIRSPAHGGTPSSGDADPGARAPIVVPVAGR